MNIYLVKDDQRQGPFTKAEVVQFIHKGECLLSTLAWREGMDEWHPLYKMTDIVAAVVPPLPSHESEPESEKQNPISNEKVADEGPLNSITPSTNPNFIEEPARQENQSSDKLRIPAILLCLFLGGLGIHAFYAGKKHEGWVFVAMSGFVLFTAIMKTGANSDMATAGTMMSIAISLMLMFTCFRIALGKYVDGQGRLIKKWI